MYNWKIILQFEHRNMFRTYKADTISEVVNWCKKFKDFHIRSITRQP